MNGIIFDIQGYSVYDGPGIRTCVFFKGCPLRCQWCHNPESHLMKPQAAWLADKGVTEEIGEEITPQEIVERVIKDKPFFEISGGGVTLTGGEATMQPAFLLAVLQAFRQEGVHTALETCGHFNPALLETLPDVTDLFLFDIKHAGASIHRAFTGVSNKKILSNFSELLRRAGCGRVTPRIPVIPGFNAHIAAMDGIISLLQEKGYQGPVHLMPYNALAKSKWEKIGRGDTYRHMGELEAQTLKDIQTQFEKASFEPVVNH